MNSDPVGSLGLLISRCPTPTPSDLLVCATASDHGRKVALLLHLSAGWQAAQIFGTLVSRSYNVIISLLHTITGGHVKTATCSDPIDTSTSIQHETLKMKSYRWLI